MNCRVATESTFQRLATTLGTPSRKKTRTRLSAPEKPSSGPSCVLHAENTASLIRDNDVRRNDDGVIRASEARMPASCDVFRPWPAKWKSTARDNCDRIAPRVAVSSSSKFAARKLLATVSPSVSTSGKGETCEATEAPDLVTATISAGASAVIGVAIRARAL